MYLLNATARVSRTQMLSINSINVLFGLIQNVKFP